VEWEWEWVELISTLGLELMNEWVLGLIEDWTRALFSLSLNYVRVHSLRVWDWWAGHGHGPKQWKESWTVLIPHQPNLPAWHSLTLSASYGPICIFNYPAQIGLNINNTFLVLGLGPLPIMRHNTQYPHLHSILVWSRTANFNHMISQCWESGLGPAKARVVLLNESYYVLLCWLDIFYNSTKYTVVRAWWMCFSGSWKESCCSIICFTLIICLDAWNAEEGASITCILQGLEEKWIIVREMKYETWSEMTYDELVSRNGDGGGVEDPLSS
jgi:hypothetical protein